MCRYSVDAVSSWADHRQTWPCRETDAEWQHHVPARWSNRSTLWIHVSTGMYLERGLATQLHADLFKKALNGLVFLTLVVPCVFVSCLRCLLGLRAVQMKTDSHQLAVGLFSQAEAILEIHHSVIHRCLEYRCAGAKLHAPFLTCPLSPGGCLHRWNTEALEIC